MSIDIQRGYYNNANILPPRHFSEKQNEAKVIEFQYPNDITSRPDKDFAFLKQDCRRMFGYWECYKPNDPTLRPDIVVARNPEHPYQRIVGPKETIPQIMLAYHTLDNFYPKNQLRNMDIIIGSIKNPKSKKRFPVTTSDQGLLFSNKVLEETGIDKLLDKTKFRKPTPDKPQIGIYCDIEWPVFFLSEQYNGLYYNSLYFASSIVHDYTHFIQKNDLGLDVYNPSTEIQAINNGANFANFALRSPIYKNAPTRQKYLIDCFLKRNSKFIKSYQNGGSGHLLEKSINRAKDANPYIPEKVYEYGKPFTFASI